MKALFISSIMFFNVPYHALAKDKVKWRGHGGWNAACHYCTGFDLNNQVTLSGTIEKIEVFNPTRAMGPGVHLQLNTRKEMIWIHLGPSWFIENQDIKLQPSDNITVRGVRTTFNGAPILVAFTIEKDGQVLTLRDPQGKPIWMGWRRGSLDD